MRTEKSIKNVIFSMLANVVGMLLGFGLQAIFVRTLKAEYLGINGLFSNIFSLMAIAEFGLVNALIYSLYKPVAEDDKEKICTLLKFYKKLYNIIAVIIFAISMGIMIFLKYIVGEVTIPENIYFIYFLFVIDIVASYLITYKRSIIYANQKTYVISIVHILYLIFMNSFQAIILLRTNNFILFLAIKVVFRILENVIINIIVNKMYPWIREKNIAQLEKEEENSIIKKIRGLLFYKIGSAVVSATDNITISTFLGVVTVGLYYNYNIILAAVNQLFSQAFNAITSSIGNLLVEEKSKERYYDVYKRIYFFNSWVYGISSCIICVVMSPFIKIWVGEEYLLPNTVLVIVVLNFYIQGIRKTYMIFKEAAGIFYEDRYYSLIEAGLNIIVSIILVKLIGLPGVFLGTIIGALPVLLYDYPIIVYKKIFNKNIWSYLKENSLFLIINIVITIVVYLICSAVTFESNIIQLIVDLLISCVIYNILFILFLFRTNEFRYYLELSKKILGKFIKKGQKET